MQPPLIIAHRTSPAFAPENSLEGIRVTFEQGADGVEIDLRMSLDLKPFLMHDNTMRRTTGWPLPIELTPSSIVRNQRLKPHVPPASSDSTGMHPLAVETERGPGGGVALSPSTKSVRGPGSVVVPTLSEAMDAVPSGKLLAVDVKTPWAVLALVPAVKQRAMQSRTLAWCSSEQVVRYLVRRLPRVEVAYYKDFEDGPNNIEFIGKAARIGAQAVSLYWLGISDPVVAAAHALGLKVYSWHKEFPITPEQLATGIDGVITDYPANARELVNTWRESCS